MQCDKDRLDVRPKEATALEKGLSFCSPSCHALMVASVLVFLPPPLPEAVLIKACSIKKCATLGLNIDHYRLTL